MDEEGNIWHTQAARLKRLNQGVRGAHLVVPFQCEICWIRLMEKRDPSPEDASFVKCIRRANLDAIAGRAEKTISSHVSRMARVVRNCEALNKTPSYPSRGPFSEYDSIGMGTAVDMLFASLTSRGRIKEHVQFDTLRQIRSTASISYQSSSAGMQEVASFTRGTGRVRSTKCPTQSMWFADFLRGCEYRMGSESRANKPITIKATIEILRRLRLRAEEESETNPHLSNYYYRVGAMIAVLTSGSLRGNEGFYLSLAGLRKHLHLGRDGIIPAGYNLHHIFSEEDAMRLPHVVLSLLGDFKGENGSDYHLLNIANVTTSGIKVRWWVEKLVAVCEREGRVKGAAFAGPDGILESALDYDATFREIAKEVQESTDYIPLELDIDIWLGLSRTPRKSAETRAKQAGVPISIQDAMNRWSTVEASKGKRTRWKATRDTYTTAVGEMPNTWRYSYAL